MWFNDKGHNRGFYDSTKPSLTAKLTQMEEIEAYEKK